MSGDHRLKTRKAVSQRVALVGAGVNLVLSVVKISVGYLSRSQALIADGIHSLSDLLSDAIVWFAAHHASEEPDAAHPYGHGKIETLATLGLGVLLILVAVGIVWDAGNRFLHPESIWVPEVIGMYAALFSIAANEGLYWYTAIKAREINSAMLKANAWHHRSDAISSIVVLVGIGGTLIGITYLDLLAAIVVGFMIGKIGWDLAKEALHELVDISLNEETVAQIRQLIQKIDGVSSIHMLRTRRQGHQAFADVHVQVAPWLSVSEGHMISIAVEETIKNHIDEVYDVTVHIDPEDDENAESCDTLPLRDKIMQSLDASWSGIDCFERRKKVLLHYLSGKVNIDLVLPLDCYKTSEETGIVKERLEKQIVHLSYLGELKLFYE